MPSGERRGGWTSPETLPGGDERTRQPRPERRERRDERELRDAVFQDIIIEKLSKQFAQELQTNGVSEGTAQEFARLIDVMRDRELAATILALPYELRARLFRDFAAGKLSANEILAKLVERTAASSQDPTIGRPLMGFHTTQQKITRVRRPSRDQPGGDVTWNVIGRERSDWSDLPMAYAARRYQDLYREKPGRYLYVVVDRESHHVDRSTGWSRAPGYPIVGEFDLAALDDEVEEIAAHEYHKAA